MLLHVLGSYGSNSKVAARSKFVFRTVSYSSLLITAARSTSSFSRHVCLTDFHDSALKCRAAICTDRVMRSFDDDGSPTTAKHFLRIISFEYIKGHMGDLVAPQV